MKTNQRSHVLATVLSAVLFSAATLQADVLAYWDMESSPTSTKVVPTTVALGLSSGNLTPVNLNAPGAFALSGVDSSDDYIAWSRSSTTGGSGDLSVDAALAEFTYFSFTLTPDFGQAITITSLTFDAAAGTAGPSDRRFYVFSDQVGYTSGDLLLFGGTMSGSPLMPYNTTTSDVNFSLNLTGNSAFENITDSVTFRFYLRTPTVSQNVGFDNITVNGLVAPVPEPSAIALLAIGGLSLLAARRRRQG